MDVLVENKDRVNQLINAFIPQIQQLHKEPDFMKHLHQDIDEIIERSGLNNQTSCAGAGCSSCCHSVIYGSQFEMDYIASEVAKRNIQPNKERAAKLNSITDEHGKNLKWMEKACPYLSDDEVRSCTIYDIRPIICRSHNSVDELSPAKCNKEGDNGYEIMNVNIKEGTILEVHAMSMALIAGTAKNESEIRLVGLHTTVPL